MYKCVRQPSTLLPPECSPLPSACSDPAASATASHASALGQPAWQWHLPAASLWLGQEPWTSCLFASLAWTPSLVAALPVPLLLWLAQLELHSVLASSQPLLRHYAVVQSPAAPQLPDLLLSARTLPLQACSCWLAALVLP